MKLKARENFRVVVIPDEPWFLEKNNLGMTEENFKKHEANCQEIVKEIKHHVEGFTEVYSDYDSSEICSFCGLEWEEEKDGRPLCCSNAVEEWEKENEKT